MTKPYFTLLERVDRQSPYGIAFGDYDRKVVEQERQDLTDEYRRQYGFASFMLIQTNDDQASINAMVDKINRVKS